MDRNELMLAYSKLGADLITFAESLLENLHDAEDAVQQALRNILESEAPPPEEARPYMFKAVRNAAFRIMRDAKRQDRKIVGWWEFRRDAGAVVDERSNAVRFAVSQLPPDMRDVVVLHHWNCLTLAETAEVLAIPKTTAEFRHKQARDLLKGTLRPEKEERS